LVEAYEEFADEAKAQVEVIATGWRVNFLAAMAGRSARRRKKVNVKFS